MSNEICPRCGSELDILNEDKILAKCTNPACDYIRWKNNKDKVIITVF